jgi:hypothetical protein
VAVEAVEAVDLHQVDVPIKVILEPAVLYQEPLGNPRMAMVVVQVVVQVDKTVALAAQLLVVTMVLTQEKMVLQ